MDSILKEKRNRNMILRNIIFDFSRDISCTLLKTEDKKKQYITKFENIYSKLLDGKKFKHSYTDVFNVLTVVKENESMSIDNLSANMGIIFEYALKVVDNNDLIENIEKLYDHITLDIAKLNYINSKSRLSIEKRDMVTEKRLRDFNYKMKLNMEKINANNDKFEDIEKKINSFQTEQVTVLSIFTAIVLSFVGGMVFSSSVLENIHKSSIYRICIVSIIIGIILITGIWGLIGLLSRINKNIKMSNMSYLIGNGILILCLVIMLLAARNDWFGIENEINEKLKAIDSENTEVIHEMISEDISTNSPKPTQKVEKKKDEETENKKEENREENKEK